ncbi:MAG: FecR domain-containing protein [Prolixibacteraceae bacterium]
MNGTTDILKRFFSGKYSAKDYRQVHAGFSGGDQVKDLMEQHWMEYEPEKSTGEQDDIDCLLDRVQHRIYLEENRRNQRIGRIQSLQRIAAVLFLPMLLSFMMYVLLNPEKPEVNGYVEIMSPKSGRTHFVLPDGSSGFLNNGSTLAYGAAFNKNREVKLKGEAYFDIVHTGVPFHVLTQKLDVKVMGTTFNVTAYEEDQTEEIILRSGQVQVFLSGGEELAVLKPDQQLILAKESLRFQMKEVDAGQFTAWTEGKLVFRNEGLEQVVRRLSRWYNVDFEIQDPELGRFTFHATFPDEPLDEVLKLLSLTTPIMYEETRRDVPANGQTLERRKITLKIDKEKMNMFQ